MTPRHRKYNPITDPMLARWAAQRQQTLGEAAKRMGIPLRLLNQWLKSHPELAAAYFHLYGIERPDIEYILDTFQGVADEYEAHGGAGETRRLTLDSYDSLPHNP